MRESAEVNSLRVDGGLTNEPLLLQLQADTIGVRVDAAGADATVLAPRAGRRRRGRHRLLEDAAELLPVDRSVEPQGGRRLARASTSAGRRSWRG